jgi:hypothetical protein
MLSTPSNPLLSHPKRDIIHGEAHGIFNPPTLCRNVSLLLNSSQAPCLPRPPYPYPPPSQHPSPRARVCLKFLLLEAGYMMDQAPNAAYMAQRQQLHAAHNQQAAFLSQQSTAYQQVMSI